MTCKTPFCFVKFGPGLTPGPFLFSRALLRNRSHSSNRKVWKANPSRSFWHSPSTCKTSFCPVESAPGLTPGPFLFPHALLRNRSHSSNRKIRKANPTRSFWHSPSTCKTSFCPVKSGPGLAPGPFLFPRALLRNRSHSSNRKVWKASGRAGGKAAHPAFIHFRTCQSMWAAKKSRKNPGLFESTHSAIFTFSAAFSGAPTSLPSGGSAGAFPRAGALRRSSSRLQSIFRPLPF